MNKRVLITGASRGIGKAIALYLAPLGYELVLCCRKNRQEAENVARVCRDAGAMVSCLCFDIQDRAKTADVLTDDIAQNGVYYGVVLNAGIAADNPFPLLTGEEWDSVVRTNLDGFYNVLKPVVMPMVENRVHGRIITLSSVSGLVGNRGQVNYSAAKAGIIGATKALALELAKHKITVNCIAPGVIETDMVKDLPVDEVKKVIPMRRLGQPQEVASLVAYLLQDDAAYITRQVISVNGGLF